MNYKILIVDDEPANVNLLTRIFSPHYDVVRASSGQEGLEMLAHHDISLIISDQRMPGMTGIEFLQKASELRPQCVRIILTGYTDAGSLIDAINSGVVYKYVTKPWVNADLLQTVKRGLSHFETLKAQNQLNTTNIRLKQRIDETNAVLVRVLMALMNSSDTDAERRGAEVRDLSLRIGRRLSLDGAELQQLALAAYLNEAGDFDAGAAAPTDEADRGGQTVLDVLSSVPGLEDLVEAISYADEHFDGSGRFGLADDQIPVFARIIAIARGFQRAGSDAAMGDETVRMDDVIQTLRAEGGGRFDPSMIDAFVGNGVTVPFSSGGAFTNDSRSLR